MNRVSDDFVCQAPDGRLDKEAYREYLASFVPHPDRRARRGALRRGKPCGADLLPQTAVTKTTPATKYFTVRDGVIVESLLMFDRLSYAPLNQR